MCVCACVGACLWVCATVCVCHGTCAHLVCLRASPGVCVCVCVQVSAARAARGLAWARLRLRANDKATRKDLQTAVAHVPQAVTSTPPHAADTTPLPPRVEPDKRYVPSLSLPLSLSLFLSLSLPLFLSLSLPLSTSLSLNFSLFLLLNLPDASSAPHPRLGYTLQHRRYPSSASYSNGLSCVGGGHVPCVCGVGGGWGGTSCVCVGGGYLMCGWGGWGGWVPHARLAHPPRSTTPYVRSAQTTARDVLGDAITTLTEQLKAGLPTVGAGGTKQAKLDATTAREAAKAQVGVCHVIMSTPTPTCTHTPPPPTPPAFPPPQHADGALQASTHHCPQCPTICSKARWGPSHRSLGRCTPGHT
jgi:hypothetical protein